MFKKMAIVALGTVFGCGVAIADTLESNLVSSHPVAFSIHGEANGENVSINTNGAVGVAHPLVNMISIGRKTVYLLVMQSRKRKNEVHVHLSIIGKHTATNANGVIIIGDSSMQKLSHGFECLAK